MKFSEGGQIPLVQQHIIQLKLTDSCFIGKNLVPFQNMVPLIINPSIFPMIVEASTLQIVLPLPWDILVEAFAWPICTLVWPYGKPAFRWNEKTCPWRIVTLEGYVSLLEMFFFFWIASCAKLPGSSVAFGEKVVMMLWHVDNADVWKLNINVDGWKMTCSCSGWKTFSFHTSTISYHFMIHFCGLINIIPIASMYDIFSYIYLDLP